MGNKEKGHHVDQITVQQIQAYLRENFVLFTLYYDTVNTSVASGANTPLSLQLLQQTGSLHFCHITQSQ